MGQNKEQLNKLLDFIDQLAKDKDNAWFVRELGNRYGINNVKPSISADLNTRIEEIYEYCVERVIREQATQFYKDFPITDLTSQLIEDYCRMERYRRQNNFGDFCLAVFQQVENITNWFCLRQKFIDLYVSKRDEDSAFKDKEGNPISTIRELIINTKEKEQYEKRKSLQLKDLFFNEKVRALLYFVFFEEKTTKYTFESKYSELNELYQCRNLNHRGGRRSEYQEDIISNILPHQYLYYLKFTGLLVGYVERISVFMARKETMGTIVNVLPSAVFIKLDNGENLTIDKGKLFYKVRLFAKNDRISIERNRITNEIINVSRIETESKN